MTQLQNPIIQTIEAIEKEYPNEWIEVEVVEMAKDDFTPLKGRLIAHGKDSNKVNEEAISYIRQHNIKTIYRNYTGELEVEALLL